MFKQAYSDAERCLGFLWFYVVGAVVIALSGVAGWYFTPSTASTLQQTVTAALSGLLGGLLLLFVVYLISLVRAPYVQRNRARTQATRLDDALRQVRKEIQEQGGYKLVDIPAILAEMWDIAKKMTVDKRKTKPESSALWSSFLDVLDVGEKDPVLSPSLYDSKTKIAHMVRVFRTRMGLKRGGISRVDYVVRRIIRAVDRQGIGVGLSNDKTYADLVAKLSHYRTHISGVRLDASIDAYILHMEGYCDVQLLYHYAETGKMLNKFPKDMGDVLEELENLIQGQMRRELIAVNQPLECWLAGNTE